VDESEKMSCDKKKYSIEEAQELFDELKEYFEVLQSNYLDDKSKNDEVYEELHKMIKETGDKELLQELENIFNPNVVCEVTRTIESGEMAFLGPIDMVLVRIMNFGRQLFNIGGMIGKVQEDFSTSDSGTTLRYRETGIRFGKGERLSVEQIRAMMNQSANQT
jgi:hypothetical protein